MAESPTVRGSSLRVLPVALAVVAPLVLLLSLAGGQRDFAGLGVPGLRVLSLLACVGLGVGLAWLAATPAFRLRCVPPSSPFGLGVIRCWVCVVAALVAVLTPVIGIVHAPTAALTSMGVMDAAYALPAGLGRFNLRVATTPTATAAFQALTAGVLLLAAAGWRTRWTLPLAALAYLLLGGIPRSHLKFFHAGLLPFFALAVLCLLPCAEAFSLDARRRRRAGEGLPVADAPTARHGRARFLVYLAVGLTYVAAGLSKFAGGGLLWAGPHNQRAMLLDQSLNPMGDAPFLPLLQATPGVVFGFMGVSALLAELGMGLTPLSRWARRIVPPVIAAMHVGTWALMGIFFWESALLMAVFLDWRPLARRLRIPLPAEPDPWEAPERPRLGVTRFALGAAVVTTVAAVPWVLRTEWYPLTAMQMFAGHHDADEVEHTRLFAVRESGAVEPAPFLDQDTLRLGRNLSLRAFDDPAERDRVARLLAGASAAANALEPADPIVRLEVRRYAYPLDGSAGDAYADPIETLHFPPPAGPEAVTDRFETWAWKKRPVVVAGPPDVVAAQLATFAPDAAGFEERDMVLVPVTADAAVAARFGFPLAPGLTVLLIGKDTGLKLRIENPAVPVPAARLFAEVDGMPMRRAEVRRSGGPGSGAPVGD